MELTAEQRRLWLELGMDDVDDDVSPGQTLAQVRRHAARDFLHVCNLEGAEPLPAEELVRAELDARR